MPTLHPLTPRLTVNLECRGHRHMASQVKVIRVGLASVRRRRPPAFEVVRAVTKCSKDTFELQVG